MIITVVYFLLYYKPCCFILGNPDHSIIILPEPTWLTSGVQSNPKDRTHRDGQTTQQILRTSWVTEMIKKKWTRGDTPVSRVLGQKLLRIHILGKQLIRPCNVTETGSLNCTLLPPTSESTCIRRGQGAKMTVPYTFPSHCILPPLCPSASLACFSGLCHH